jgi:GTPase SAR1 family protein
MVHGLRFFTPLGLIFLSNVSVATLTTVSNTSLSPIAKKNWLAEIRILAPGASYILVGTKTDLREDKSKLDELQTKKEKAISIQDGIKTAKAIGAKTH